MKREELLKNAKPILFNTEMVRAILEDRKTVTRRVIKVDLNWADTDENDSSYLFFEDKYGDSYNAKYFCRYQVGDILYVRETWNLVYDYDDDDQIIWDSERYVYYADNPMPFTHWITEDGDYLDQMPWKPSIHMPKEAARLFLKVTGVRVERLKDITDEAAIKEGIEKEKNYYKDYSGSNNYCTPRGSFRGLWNSTINKQDLDLYGWEANPYVWVIEFEKVEVEV